MGISNRITRQYPRIRVQHPMAAACAAGLLAIGLAGSVWAGAVPAGVAGGQGGTPRGLRSAHGGAAGNGGQGGSQFTSPQGAGSVGAAGNGGAGGGSGHGTGGTVGLTATVSSTVTGATGSTGGNGSSGNSGPGGCRNYNSGAGGGGGGDGVFVSAGVVVTNRGGSTILGGAGGAGGYGYCYYHPGAGGGGGNGVEFAGTGSLVNKGVIQGGAAGATGAIGVTGATASYGPSGAGGGHGVVGSGITIVNSGSIASGAASYGSNGGSTNGTNGDAILFTGGSNTLSLLTGSTITGNIELATGASASIAPQNTGLSLSNNIVLDASSSAAKFNTQYAPLTVSGVVSGAGSISEAGSNSSPLILSATNTFTGGSYVYSGNLQVDGTIANLGMSGGVLSGVGSVGNITVNGGSVSPGEASQMFGVLSSSGTVNLSAASTLSIRSTDGVTCSLLQSAGVLTLAGNLSIHFENAPKIGASCTVFASFSNISGTFAKVVSAPATITVAYNASSIQITVTASDDIFADGFDGGAR